jgi:dihydroflavonol-4-reductase
MNKIALITGGTGYIGSWVCKYLLEEGYTLRVSVRSKTNTRKFAHLEAIAASSKGKLEFWEADLLKEGSFNEAAKGCDVIYHIASPFILNVKDAQKELIDPAVMGTKNVLQAATQSGTVKKVILTSSVAAVYGDAIDMTNQGLSAFTEAQWNTTSSLTHQPYSYSKVLAEKAAWEMANAQQQWTLVVINPSFVMGPALTASSDSESIKLIKDFLAGKFITGVPELRFGIVDVRDIAKAHILAEQNPDAAGRHIISNLTLSMLEIGNLIKKVTGKSFGLPFMTAPKWLIANIGFLFGVTKDFVNKNVGFPLVFDNNKSKTALKLTYHKVEDTMKDMIDSMKKQGIV